MHKLYRNLANTKGFKTSEIETANVVSPETKKEMLVRTHFCSAKRHLWFRKSKEIRIKSIHDKVANNQCEKSQKYVLCAIHEKFKTDKISEDYPLPLISVDFLISSTQK